jgi:hypothetical protein
MSRPRRQRTPRKGRRSSSPEHLRRRQLSALKVAPLHVLCSSLSASHCLTDLFQAHCAAAAMQKLLEM